MLDVSCIRKNVVLRCVSEGWLVLKVDNARDEAFMLLLWYGNHDVKRYKRLATFQVDFLRSDFSLWPER